jgi:hypothetical protein
MATKPKPKTEAAPVFCARCAAELLPGRGDFYQVTIEAVADPTPPAVTAEEMQGDLRGQIEELLARLAQTSAQEAMDQVHRRLTLHLCRPCYVVWIENPAG